MLDAIRNATAADMNDTELAAALVDRLPTMTKARCSGP